MNTTLLDLGYPDSQSSAIVLYLNNIVGIFPQPDDELHVTKSSTSGIISWWAWPNIMKE